MSRFFSKRLSHLTPYTPGEQPKERRFIKLNTNESPFPPSLKAEVLAADALKRLQLYPDPECRALSKQLAVLYGVDEDEIVWTNGSDDVLNFAFMAFCDSETPAVFPDITYGFYSVFAKLNGVPFETIPLKDDFSVCPADYFYANKTIFIANPNAPTGLVLSVEEIEDILKNNPNNVVVIDEAYVDFGGESCVPLIQKYDNLLVTQTFSKSRSMAGARLGFGIASKELIRDLNTIRYSTNPYNINSMTMAAGIGTLQDDSYTRKNCKAIIETRARCAKNLKKMGFVMTDSHANFLFIKHPSIEGEKLYGKLKEKGVLVRHFNVERIKDFCRVTIGSDEEMDIFLKHTKEILEDENATSRNKA